MNFNSWQSITDKSLEQVFDLILTGADIQTTRGDTWLYHHIGKPNDVLCILDFGCGVGRNSFELSKHFPHSLIVGYDSSNMLEFASLYASKKYGKQVHDFANVFFMTDWDAVMYHKCSVVLATIVFQHIKEEDIKKYVADIKKTAKILIVHGRRFNDEIVDGKYKNTWKILSDCGLTPVKCIKNGKESPFSIEGPEDEHFTCIYNL